MLNEDQIRNIVQELCTGLAVIFPEAQFDIILYGSYARGEGVEGSDIDVLLLADVPREIISQHSWEIGDVAAELLLDHGVVISPIVENREYFNINADVLPFYRNIRQEGVRISA